MLEWLEVRLDVGCDKRLMYEYRIEPLKCDRDALKQEWHLSRASPVAALNRRPTSVRTSKEQGAIAQSFERDWYKDKTLWETIILGLLPRGGKLLLLLVVVLISF